MKAVFLDRDGVINKYPGDTKYVTKWKDFHFLPRSKEAIAKLHKHKFEIFIVSNQAGVGKGIYSRLKLDLITRNMLKGIKKAKGRISSIHYCTHRPDEDCACRKPKAGSVHAIRKVYPVDLKHSFFVGDTIRDVLTAKAAGCKSILVLSGKEKLKNRKNWEVKPDHVFKNLFQAAEFIIRQR